MSKRNERRSRRGRVTFKWEEERRDFVANRGLEVEEIERLRDRNNRWFKEMKEREIKKGKREKGGKE